MFIIGETKFQLSVLEPLVTCINGLEEAVCHQLVRQVFKKSLTIGMASVHSAWLSLSQDFHSAKKQCLFKGVPQVTTVISFLFERRPAFIPQSRHLSFTPLLPLSVIQPFSHVLLFS